MQGEPVPGPATVHQPDVLPPGLPVFPPVPLHPPHHLPVEPDLVVAARGTEGEAGRIPGVRLPGGVGHVALPVSALRDPEDLALLPAARHVGVDVLHLQGAVFLARHGAGNRHKASQECQVVVQVENHLERVVVRVGGELVGFKSGADGELWVEVEGGILHLHLPSPVRQLYTGVGRDNSQPTRSRRQKEK